MYKVWINTDETGTITEVYGGIKQIIFEPIEAYQYYFEVPADVYKSIGSYQIVDGDLVKKDTPPITDVYVKTPTLEEEVEQLKKENEMNALAIMELAELVLGG